MPADALLCDVTSVKTGPVKAMLAAHKGPVAGLHPMFGPDVTDFRAQVFVHSPGRFESAAEPLLEQIRLWGGKVVRCSAEDHDRAMSIIQALRHFTTYAYGVFLSEIKPDLHRILSLSSPIYRLELLMVGRLLRKIRISTATSSERQRKERTDRCLRREPAASARHRANARPRSIRQALPPGARLLRRTCAAVHEGVRSDPCKDPGRPFLKIRLQRSVAGQQTARPQNRSANGPFHRLASLGSFGICLTPLRKTAEA